MCSEQVHAHAGDAIVSSPGMHEMAKQVVSMLASAENGAVFPHIKAECTTFKNGEIKPWVTETVRGEHVFLMHPLQYPDPNTAFVALSLTLDALTRASVDGITLVLPYMSYLRQDRKDKPRVPISGSVLARMIESYREVRRVITLDMHADQIQGFFRDIPVDNLNGGVVFAEHFRKYFRDDFRNVMVVATDVGGGTRARRFAECMNATIPVALFDKRRSQANQVDSVFFVGDKKDVAGKSVILFDDMIDTGGTIRAGAGELIKYGAKEVFVCATHAVLSGGAEHYFREAGFKVVVMPTIPRPGSYWAEHSSWLEAVPLEPLLAETILQASIVGGSVSKLLVRR